MKLLRRIQKSLEQSEQRGAPLPQQDHSGPAASPVKWDIYATGALIANRYGVIKTLAGGMGIVYLCLDLQADQPVALKTFKPEYLPNRDIRDRFLREGTTWVNLGHHPHIVRAYGVERVGDGREVYLVLEWVTQAEGKHNASLRAWLTPSQPLPVEQALLFALHIARGMKHATTKIPGLVHRDLKPENVLVGRDGNARVTDFGLVQTLAALSERAGPLAAPTSGGTEGTLGHTQLTHGGVVGTPLYMAPEQWTPGEPLDVRADIYAFGCTLYEMLTGNSAAVGENLRELEQSHRTGRLRELPHGLPVKVEILVQRCLALNREERHGRWEEVESRVMEIYQRAFGKEAPSELAVEDETRAERVVSGWSYNALGASYLDIGKFEVAIRYFERAAHIGQAEKERELEGAALGNLGHVYATLGDARRAIEFFQQTLAIAREIQDRAKEASTLNHLGVAYAALGDVQRAIRFYEQAFGIAEVLGDLTEMGSALGNLGNAYQSLGDAQRAIDFHQKDLAIMQKIGDRRGEGHVLGNLGATYYSLGDMRRAIGFFEQSLVIAQGIGDRHQERAILGNLGTAYCDSGDLQRAIALFEQALVIARETGARAGEVKALGNIGNAYARLRDAQRAIGFSEQSLAIAKEIGDRDGEGNALINLGASYTILGNMRQAIVYLEQALATARETGDRRKEFGALGGLGNAYQSMGNMRQAIAFFEQCLAIVQKTGDRTGECEVLGSLGTAHYSLGDVRRAIEIFGQALDIAQEIGNVLGAAGTCGILAEILVEHGLWADALSYAEYAAQIYAKAGYKQDAQKAQLLIAQIRKRGEK